MLHATHIGEMGTGYEIRMGELRR